MIAAPFWSPGPSFAGLTVTIIGGGPSHSRFNAKLLRGRRLIAVNSASKHVRPIATAADILFFADHSWAAPRPEVIEDWPGSCVTTSRLSKLRFGDAARRIDVREVSARLGVAPALLAASSGHAAACLAAVMGAVRIILIGFECAAPKGRSHGHNDYAHRDTGIYAKRFLPGWHSLAPAFTRMGVMVLNATPGSAIQDFPFVELSEALSR